MTAPAWGASPPVGLKTVDDWAAWLASTHLIFSVRPTDAPACIRCRGPLDADRGYSSCFNCGMHLAGTTAAVVPISYAASGGLTAALAVAKNEFERVWWLRSGLVSLLAVFLRDHRACLERAAGGPFDLAMVVPSHPSSRAGRDHLKELVALVKPSGPGPVPWHNDLLEMTKPSSAKDRRGRAQADLFTLAAGVDVRGKRILLLDDLYTSGGTSASAAVTLIAAGAEPPVVVTFGRHIDTRDTSKDFVTANDLDNRGWEPDTCAVHQAASPETDSVGLGLPGLLPPW